jgi:hypothetical protein
MDQLGRFLGTPRDNLPTAPLAPTRLDEAGWCQQRTVTPSEPAAWGELVDRTVRKSGQYTFSTKDVRGTVLRDPTFAILLLPRGCIR